MKKWLCVFFGAVGASLLVPVPLMAVTFSCLFVWIRISPATINALFAPLFLTREVPDSWIVLSLIPVLLTGVYGAYCAWKFEREKFLTGSKEFYALYLLLGCTLGALTGLLQSVITMLPIWLYFGMKQFDILLLIAGILTIPIWSLGGIWAGWRRRSIGPRAVWKKYFTSLVVRK